MASDQAAKFRAVAGTWAGSAHRAGSQALSFAGGTTIGKEMGVGFAESFGFMQDPRGQGLLGSGKGTMFSRTGQYSSAGFLGMGTSAAGRYGRMFGQGHAPSWGMGSFQTRSHSIHGQISTGARTAGLRGQALRGAAQKAGQFRAAGHFIKERGVRAAFKGAGGKMGGMGIAGHALGVGFAAHAMYTGYQEGGVTGAVGAGVRFGAEWGAMRAGIALLAKAGIGAGVLAPLAIAAGGAYGFYQFGEAAQEYGKQMKSLEMGAPIVDPFGTVATTRQRSLMALNNTHINGRMAMGNEGILMHDGAYRR